MNIYSTLPHLLDRDGICRLVQKLRMHLEITKFVKFPPAKAIHFLAVHQKIVLFERVEEVKSQILICRQFMCFNQDLSDVVANPVLTLQNNTCWALDAWKYHELPENIAYLVGIPLTTFTVNLEDINGPIFMAEPF